MSLAVAAMGAKLERRLMNTQNGRGRLRALGSTRFKLTTQNDVSVTRRPVRQFSYSIKARIFHRGLALGKCRKERPNELATAIHCFSDGRLQQPPPRPRPRWFSSTQNCLISATPAQL